MNRSMAIRVSVLFIQNLLNFVEFRQFSTP